MMKSREYAFSSTFLVGCLLLVVSSAAQQQPLTTQYMFNRLAINPAYAGAEEVMTLNVLGRYQWLGLEKAPTTFTLSAHAPIRNRRIGLGITMVHDQVGVHSNLYAASDYSYRILIGPSSFFSMGLRVGLTNAKSDYASIAGGTNDPMLGLSTSETRLQLGTGVYFHSNKVDLGVSAPALLNNSIQLSDTLTITNQAMNLLGFAQLRLPMNRDWVVVPSILMRYYEALPMSVDVNANFEYRRVLTMGTAYRIQRSVAVLFKFQLNVSLQFGYAYDWPLASAAYTGSPSHEVFLQYAFRRVHRSIPSPRY